MNRVLSNKRLYSASVSNAHDLKSIGAGFWVKKNNSENSGRAGLSIGIVFLIVTAIFLGGAYLYQVNKVATQGMDMREVENKIKELDNENKKLKIKEVELKSMYNIEKSMENLNFVNVDGVSYIEMEGPVAMK